MLLESRQLLLKCLRQVLRPVVAFCLRRRISLPDLIEGIKFVLVEEATHDLRTNGSKVNSSRIAVATGLHRREVQRIFDGHEKSPNLGLAMRILGEWQGNKKFCTKAGKPKVLTYDGDECEFVDLVKNVSSDMHPGTMLFELERIGAIKREGARVTLMNEAYMPTGDPEEIFKLYAIDGEHLLSCIEENAFLRDEQRNLHVRTEYDNVDRAKLPEIKAWLYREGNKLHHKARNFISKYDLDLNLTDNQKAGGARVVLGSFSRIKIEQKLDNKDNDKQSD